MMMNRSFDGHTHVGMAMPLLQLGSPIKLFSALLETLIKLLDEKRRMISTQSPSGLIILQLLNILLILLCRQTKLLSR
jgi:hypothetical protein